MNRPPSWYTVAVPPQKDRFSDPHNWTRCEWREGPEIVHGKQAGRNRCHRRVSRPLDQDDLSVTAGRQVCDRHLRKLVQAYRGGPGRRAALMDRDGWAVRQ